MPPMPEALAERTRWLQDAGRLAFLALLLIPIYVLCNDYWQSLLRLIGLYLALIFFCSRLGGYLHRVMRRLPAEIPPWHQGVVTASALPMNRHPFATAEVIQSVQKDPNYVQDVLKPRLQQMLAYRLSGSADMPLEALDARQLARVEPVLLEFLQRQEATDLWTHYGCRRRRLNEVLEMLRHLEAL